jgi:hypothetical protein
MENKTVPTEEIGATLCDSCEKIIYESEMNSIEYMDWTVVCNDCLKETEENND